VWVWTSGGVELSRRMGFGRESTSRVTAWQTFHGTSLGKLAVATLPSSAEFIFWFSDEPANSDSNDTKKHCVNRDESHGRE
jgi:hypothetical protein